MPARAQGRAGASAAPDLAALDRVSDAVESGAGLPEVARSAGAALGASVIVLDSTSSVLAVACASPDEERAVMAGEGGVRGFLEDLLARRLTDRENIVARAGELGCELAGGASVLAVRARPRQPEGGDWRGRVLHGAGRGSRAGERGALPALGAVQRPQPQP